MTSHQFSPIEIVIFSVVKEIGYHGLDWNFSRPSNVSHRRQGGGVSVYGRKRRVVRRQVLVTRRHCATHRDHVTRGRDVWAGGAIRRVVVRRTRWRGVGHPKRRHTLSLVAVLRGAGATAPAHHVRHPAGVVLLLSLVVVLGQVGEFTELPVRNRLFRRARNWLKEEARSE